MSRHLGGHIARVRSRVVVRLAQSHMSRHFSGHMTLLATSVVVIVLSRWRILLQERSCRERLIDIYQFTAKYNLFGNSARPLVIILHGRPSFPLGRPSSFHLLAADMVALDICLLDICLVI